MKTVDLHTVLPDLFYRHNELIIPGVGGFSLAYQSAVVDQVQGLVHAPSKQVSFNPNLVLDDGILQQYLQEAYELSAAEAERTVAEFAAKLTDRLDRRELVELPSLGRLYRNFENKLQFLADGSNFDAGTYGLPAVPAYPVSRQPAETRAAIQPNVAQDTPSAAPASLSWLQHNLGWVIGLAAVLLVLGIFGYTRWVASAKADLTSALPAERLNVNPNEGIWDEEEPIPPGVEDEEALVPAAPSADGEDRYAVIAVGLFKQDNNVQRLIRRIAESGFEPYSAREDGSTRVGVQVRFTEEAELDNALREVRQRFNARAFVMEVDGQRTADNG